MSEKKEYELAVEAFQTADKEYQAIQEKFLNGDWLPEHVRGQFVTLIEQIRSSLEDRNAKLTAAKNAMRQAVVLGPSQWRGHDGKTTVVSSGPFNCNSTTKRTFDPKSLLDGVQRHGLLESLLELKGIDKEGKEYRLVQQVWEVDYEPVKNWLAANKLTDVLDGAYDEKEGTPTVKGPKPLAFLGEELKGT